MNIYNPSCVRTSSTSRTKKSGTLTANTAIQTEHAFFFTFSK